jgi:hypothetical protein
MVNGDNVVVDVSSSQGALSGALVTDPSSTFVALKIAPRSRKDRKTNPIWIFFCRCSSFGDRVQAQLLRLFDLS